MAITPKQRWTVFARDGFTCQYCGRKPPQVALHVDHKQAKSRGGSDELGNLVTACASCNLGKGTGSIFSDVQSVIDLYGDFCHHCQDERIHKVLPVAYKFASQSLIGICDGCFAYLSSGEGTDPAVQVVWEAMSYGIIPIDHEGTILWWSTRGQTKLGHHFYIDFKNTGEPEEYLVHETTIIPYGPNLWIHAWWM